MPLGREHLRLSLEPDESGRIFSATHIAVNRPRCVHTLVARAVRRIASGLLPID